MSQNPLPPDQYTILQSAWDHVVGGVNWLNAVLLGEFADHRPLSVVVADMLVSFVPGVVIVTSARDAAAVILRLANHPEKREELMEWVLLSACLVVIALPIAMAAGGAVAAGVGAAVSGIVGSELGAALRAVMLMLIKEASKLVELVRFLQKFMKGDILKFLRAVKFVQYEKALIQAMGKITGKLLEIVRALRTHLESLRYFDAVKTKIAKLTEWESKFYSVQQDAIKQMPKALAELDARLANFLTQTAPKEAHTVAAGVQADKSAAVLPAKQRVKDTPGAILVQMEPRPFKTENGVAHGKDKPLSKPELKTGSSVKNKADPIEPHSEKNNTKKQAVLDGTVAADRERITQLSNEGKIGEAQAVLQPYVDAAKNAKTTAEKRVAMEAIIQRLDVSSNKEKMFWSGNKELAAKIATEKGKTILEQTAGGKVINEWKDLNNTFSWDSKDLGPHGWDLWGDVSAKYSKDATGEIDIIQDIKKFPAGGDTWSGSEWPTIVQEGKVTSMNIFGMDKDGNIIKTMKTEPDSEIARDLFGGN
jgi:hypothetical protein